MKIFVISLKTSERRKRFNAQMEKLNLPFEYFDAVNGKELSAKEVSEHCDEEALNANPKWLNRGAIGCALSHLHLYKKMVALDIEKAIIIEDDMVLTDDFAAIYKFLAERKTNTEELIQLYYRAFDLVEFSEIGSLAINTKFKIFKPVTLDDIPTTNGCYYLTKSVASKLVKVISPIRVTADSWKYFVLKSDFDNIKVIHPRPVKYGGAKSEIDYHGSYSNIILRIIKLISDKLNLAPINFLQEKIRKSIERDMSQFKTTNKKSTLKLQKEKLLESASL